VVTSNSSRNGRTRFVLAAIAGLVGLVWLLQGVGLLPGSFMTGDASWAAVGLGLIGFAAIYGLWPRLRRR
jgi:hypothetical protein